MGDVYKATDTRLWRTVAIKVTKERFSECFQREARTVASLNDANVCTLYDVGPHYLVMEYIKGKPLKGPWPVAQALKYASGRSAGGRIEGDADARLRDRSPNPD